MHPDVSYAVGVIGGTGSIAVTFKQTESNEIQELGRVRQLRPPTSKVSIDIWTFKQIGGWGWILGDEGGGFYVGREAIRQVLEANDRASVSTKPQIDGPLVQKILRHFSVDSIMEVLPAVHNSDPQMGSKVAAGAPAYVSMAREKRLSTICPLVFAAAFEDHDPLALKVLRNSAGTLAGNLDALLGEPTEEKPKLIRAKETVISFGGSLVGIEEYRKLVLEALAEKGHAFAHVEFVDDAAATGAKGLASSFN